MLEYGSCKLYKISKDKYEYKRLRNTLAKTNKLGRLDDSIINDTLMGETLVKLAGNNEVYLLHDPSPIRKPHSSKVENLGKVTDLNGKVINGYSTHNIVAITPKTKDVHLLFHKSYSNKDRQFIKTEFLKNIKAGKEFEDKELVYPLYETNNWFNKKTITKSAIRETSKKIKLENPDIKITHVLDREFDDDEYFNFITDEKDEFVIRSKKSRKLSDEKDASGKKLKLINSLFKNGSKIAIQKIMLKKQCYQDVIIEIEWTDYFKYTAVKITIKDRNNKNIFKDPMLLITNKTVKDFDDAQCVYQIYLKRSRIECVFKTLKDGLGWEEMQLKDFQAIQNLLALCFFVAAYLYEVEKLDIKDDYVVFLAKLGGGKGTVSRHYILQGIHTLIAKSRADFILKNEGMTEDDVNNILAMLGVVM